MLHTTNVHRPDTRKAAVKSLLAIAVTVVVTTGAFAEHRSLDRGGQIDEYQRRIATHRGPYMISGDCMSSCTLWLGYKGTCVTPEAVFWFHSASFARRSQRNANPWQTVSGAGNEELLRAYPPRVRAVVASWLQTPEYHMLTGSELAALGVPLCGSSDTLTASVDTAPVKSEKSCEPDEPKTSRKRK